MNVRVYDNGGKSADRYTAVFMAMPEHIKGLYFSIGMSADPFHPLGVGMSCAAMPGRHLGRRIAIEELPPDCQRLVRDIASEH